MISPSNNKEEISTGQLEDLKLTLSRYNIPIDQWGHGEAKTVEHLLREVQDGETLLVRDGERIVRQVSVAVIDVMYQEGNNKYQLIEDHQEFKDGRTRRRDIGGSIAEKLSPGELPLNTATRALKDELGIESQTKISTKGSEESFKQSPSYPGLNTKYVRHFFEAQLNQGQYNPDGYVERQPDKTTYFVWRRQ